MNSLSVGKSTLINNSVTSITSLGFYMIVEETEYFVSFHSYPEFKNAVVDDIFDMKSLSPRQIYWEKLDIDIDIDELEQPERFPLKYRR